MMAIDI